MCLLTGDTYDVEGILGHRDKAGVREYKVRWAGYNATHDSWEPEGNLEGCKDKLQEYLGEVLA